MYKDETWLNADIIKYNDISIAQGIVWTAFVHWKECKLIFPIYWVKCNYFGLIKICTFLYMYKYLICSLVCKGIHHVENEKFTWLQPGHLVTKPTFYLNPHLVKRTIINRITPMAQTSWSGRWYGCPWRTSGAA